MEILTNAPLEPMDAHMLQPSMLQPSLFWSPHTAITLNVKMCVQKHVKQCTETQKVPGNPNTRPNLDAALFAPQEVPLTTPLLVADLSGWDLVPKN